jgi:L-rhamnose mutarotase
MRRFGQVVRVRPERYQEYVDCHREIWPGVAAMIRECNIRNYSIYHWDGVLFAYLEYVGEDFEKDMEKMAADPETQRWWDYCKPMHIPLEERAPGEWWMNLQEIFHSD